MRKAITFLAGLTAGIAALTIVHAAADEALWGQKSPFALEINRVPFEGESFLVENTLYAPLEQLCGMLGAEAVREENGALAIYNEYYDKVFCASKQEFTYKDITFGMSPLDVMRKLGIPKTVLSGGQYTMVYDDCKIKLSSYYGGIDSVWEIEIINPLYQTVKGIKIGDDKLDVIKLYGKPHIQREGNRLSYSDDDNFHYIIFEYDEENKIIKISLFNKMLG